jgi:hypothetical protein
MKLECLGLKLIMNNVNPAQTFKHGSLGSRPRHIEINTAAIRDKRVEVNISIQKITGIDNWPNLLTKPMTQQVFNEHCLSIDHFPKKAFYKRQWGKIVKKVRSIFGSEGTLELYSEEGSF